MKLPEMLCKVARENDDFPLVYRPQETSLVQNETNGEYDQLEHLQSENIKIAEGFEPTLFKKYDALHYFFVEANLYQDIVNSTESSEIAAEHLANNLKDYLPVILKNGDVPDWKTVRDNTSFIHGSLLGNVGQFVDAFKHGIFNGYVHIDADDIHTRTKNQVWSVLHKLLALDGEHKHIVEDRLVQYFNVREALAFVTADPDDEITIDSVPGKLPETQRKWFWESKWLTEHVLVNFPQFRTNFHTLIITNANKRINSEDLNLNKLYRVLARMGRVNTRIVFIG